MIKRDKIHIKKKILITGGSGFVGKNLFYFLNKKNIYKIYRPSRSKYDLSNLNVYKNILIKFQPNIIIHLAARTKPTILTKKEDRLQFKNTILPVINLVNCLKYCLQLEKIIFFGSIEEYGLSKLPFTEKQKPIPVKVGACGVGEGFFVLIYLKDTVVLAMLTLARAAIEKESALAAREGGVPVPFFFILFNFYFCTLCHRRGHP